MAKRLESDQLQPIPSDVPIGRIDMSISRLKPDMIDTTGQIICPSNLLECASTARESILKTSWYPSLIRDVRNHKKAAIFITGLGGITIFVAAVGFEFGIRHGRDMRILEKMLKHGK